MTRSKLVGVVVCTVALLAVACLNAGAMMAHNFRASQPTNPEAPSPIELPLNVSANISAVAPQAKEAKVCARACVKGWWACPAWRLSVLEI